MLLSAKQLGDVSTRLISVSVSELLSFAVYAAKNHSHNEWKLYAASSWASFSNSKGSFL